MGKCRRVGVGPLEVALHHVMPANDDLPALALRQCASALSMDRHLIRADRTPYRRIPALRHPGQVLLLAQVDRQEARVASGLAEAIAVNNADVEAVVELGREIRRERPGPADDVPESRKVELPDVVVPFAKEREDGGDDADPGALLLGQCRPE